MTTTQANLKVKGGVMHVTRMARDRRSALYGNSSVPNTVQQKAYPDQEVRKTCFIFACAAVAYNTDTVRANCVNPLHSLR